MKDIDNTTPEMVQLAQENDADSIEANYIEVLKVQRDRWERECVEAQTTARRLTRQNKILQLRIEQLEKATENGDAQAPEPETIDATQQERLN
jgi:hypothetical protein